MRRLLDDWALLLKKTPFTEEDVAALYDFEIEFHYLLGEGVPQHRPRNTAARDSAALFRRPRGE